MTNLVEVEYAQTGKSSNTDELGMREMQAMVYAQRHRQHRSGKQPRRRGALRLSRRGGGLRRDHCRVKAAP